MRTAWYSLGEPAAPARLAQVEAGEHRRWAVVQELEGASRPGRPSVSRAGRRRPGRAQSCEALVFAAAQPRSYAALVRTPLRAPTVAPTQELPRFRLRVLSVSSRLKMPSARVAALRRRRAVRGECAASDHPRALRVERQGRLDARRRARHLRLPTRRPPAGALPRRALCTAALNALASSAALRPRAYRIRFNLHGRHCCSGRSYPAILACSSARLYARAAAALCRSRRRQVWQEPRAA